MEVYLDNSATTRCSERAGRMMMKVLTEDYGNPSSLHNMGKYAEDYIREAKGKIARTLKVNEKELTFTSGGTESNNMALIGAALGNPRPGRHIITTQIEHPSVREPLEYLKESGYEITYLGVDRAGRISLNELADAIRADTVLVSIMMVNNEIGTVEPVEEAAKLIKAKNPQTLFHVDAIQAYGKFRIYPKKAGIDLLSVSGHKIRAPKGTGFLYIRDKVKVKPLIYGGGQQKGLRSGTENVPGIAALGEAAAEAYERFEEKTEQMYGLRDRLVGGIMQIPGLTVNGPATQAVGVAAASPSPDAVANGFAHEVPPACAAAVSPSPDAVANGPAHEAQAASPSPDAVTNGPAHEAQAASPSPDVVANDPAHERKFVAAAAGGTLPHCCAPHIVSVTAEGVRSEVLLHALEEAGIYVSAGSACSSNKPAPSRTLLGIGLTREQAESTIRLSMGAETTEEEIDYTLGTLAELVPVLRRFRRK